MVKLSVIMKLWNRTWFVADKDQKFYECRIMKLPDILLKDIEQNGKYIID